jgi:6-pyruvoyltetrahydropterin/6-carboxytetrahydropterin synthase
MVELRRTVRFCINPAQGQGPPPDSGAIPSGPSPNGSGPNGFGGVPSMHGLGRYYELEFVCKGEADAQTGYLINIKDVDRAARSAVIPLIERAVNDTPWTDPAAIMPSLLKAARAALTVRVASLRWNLTPTYSVEMEAGSPSRVVLRQRFDFAAAHRLHVPGLSDEQNRATFGRCNNPSGHGHNYRIEPAVAFDAANTESPFTLADLERLTHTAIIEPFDHTHLNKDTAPFAEAGGLNPSVENIARVFHGLLAAAVRRERPDAELVSMTVWETDRTSCTFPG